MSGCAKLPGDAIGQRATRVVFRLVMANDINPNYVYMVALRPSNETNPTEQGPIPIVAPPWGNGFVAGTVSHFVSWRQDQFPRYQLYEFRNANLLDYRAIGVPVSYIDWSPGNRVLEFEVDMAQLAPTLQEALAYQSLQINILTMDRVPQGSSGSKNWDALGDGSLPSEVNTPITIPLRTANTYTNATYLNLEPNGDVADPALDLVDFSIEVRPQ